MKRIRDAAPVTWGAYVRVSSGEQEDNYSFQTTQEAACRAYIEAQGGTLDDAMIFRDILTGSVLRRPGLDAARPAIARRAVQRMVVYRLDRAGRDADDRVFIRVESRQKGCEWLSATERNDDSAEGKLLDYVAGWAAGWERRAIIQRTQDGTRARVDSGKRLVGCKAPYGYRFTEDTDERGRPLKSGLVVAEPEASVVRRIFAAAAAGQSFRSIARGLTGDGVPIPNPRRAAPTKPPMWHLQTLHLICHNPVYKGLSVAYRREGVAPKSGGDAKSSTAVRPENDWVVLPDGTAPAIVSVEEWDAVQRRIATARDRSERSAHPKWDAILRGGFVVCGYCGGPLHVNRKPNGKNDYRCANQRRDPACDTGQSVRVEMLDGPVWEWVENILANPGVIAAKLRASAGEDTSAREVAGIAAALVDLSAQGANLTDAIARVTSAGAMQALTTKLDAIGGQRHALRRRQADAQLKSWRTAPPRSKPTTSPHGAIGSGAIRRGWTMTRSATPWSGWG